MDLLDQLRVGVLALPRESPRKPLLTQELTLTQMAP